VSEGDWSNESDGEDGTKVPDKKDAGVYRILVQQEPVHETEKRGTK
jgi:hypothetical protein